MRPDVMVGQKGPATDRPNGPYRRATRPTLSRDPRRYGLRVAESPSVPADPVVFEPHLASSETDAAVEVILERVRDLHDGVIQGIYAVGLSLEDVPDLMGEDPREARARVDHAIDALHVTIQQVREFILDRQLGGPDRTELVGPNILSALGTGTRVIIASDAASGVAQEVR
jgi:hypothetical protein